MSNQIDFSKKQSFNENNYYKERRRSLNNIRNENNYFKRSNTLKNNLMGNIINSLKNNYDDKIYEDEKENTENNDYLIFHNERNENEKANNIKIERNKKKSHTINIVREEENNFFYDFESLESLSFNGEKSVKESHGSKNYMEDIFKDDKDKLNKNKESFKNIKSLSNSSNEYISKSDMNNKEINNNSKDNKFTRTNNKEINTSKDNIIINISDNNHSSVNDESNIFIKKNIKKNSINEFEKNKKELITKINNTISKKFHIRNKKSKSLLPSLIQSKSSFWSNHNSKSNDKLSDSDDSSIFNSISKLSAQNVEKTKNFFFKLKKNNEISNYKKKIFNNNKLKAYLNKDKAIKINLNDMKKNSERSMREKNNLKSNDDVMMNQSQTFYRINNPSSNEKETNYKNLPNLKINSVNEK